MIVTLESTTLIVRVNGVQCRIWQGATAAGLPVRAYACDLRADATELERDLREHMSRPEVLVEDDDAAADIDVDGEFDEASNGGEQ